MHRIDRWWDGTQWTDHRRNRPARCHGSQYLSAEFAAAARESASYDRQVAQEPSATTMPGRNHSPEPLARTGSLSSFGYRHRYRHAPRRWVAYVWVRLSRWSLRMSCAT
ncbi:DUF2510 domain-containing protein [Nocardia niigatensis]